MDKEAELRIAIHLKLHLDLIGINLDGQDYITPQNGRVRLATTILFPTASVGNKSVAKGLSC
ncbi:hypothetical protein A3I50_01515 [Candidatus Roizmanbacteria bacterium RIFCSPLOWO2_02_FULL_37_9]|nr:MAG: hypothetical protein A3F57_01240 [Candidatus Roizmanbacteria bacterium RIFCSPHIGHO2_12_FULL_36_11]OGK56560.1 MAG: hypothetical protein A3I50_01515 [Candidatus Roizmanbacteria bacterium RIFCSPLOWO2_02_FULL_37_9]